MSQLSAIGQAAIRMFGNCNFSVPVLAINAAAALTVKTTSAINYSYDGLGRTKAVLAAQVLTALSSADLATSLANWLQPTGLAAAFSTQPASTTAYYVFVLTSAGNVRVVQGLYTGQVPLIGLNTTGGGRMPDVPDGVVPFGLLKVVTGATTFAPATDALDKALVTFTFSDVVVLPSTDTP